MTRLARGTALLTSTLGLAALLAACGGGGGGGGDGAAAIQPTALQVQVELSREMDDVLGITGVEWYVAVSKDGLGLNNATVAVNGIPVPRVVGFVDGYYDLTSDAPNGATFTPGASYTVSVTVDGVAYTDTLTAPGGITLAADGGSASWTAPADYATVDVDHRYGSKTWGVPSARPGHLDSPQAVPSSAYPSAGDYTLTVWLQNHRWPAGAQVGQGYFASLAGTRTSFVVNDYRRRLVTR